VRRGHILKVKKPPWFMVICNHTHIK
jgi:hypothetical protein